MNKAAAVVVHEIREALPVFVFFLAVLVLGRATQALLLEGYRITVGGTAVAVVGALIVAKAVLIADALPVTRRFARQAPLVSIVWKSLVYGLIVLAFRYLEELIPLWRHSGDLAAAHRQLLAETSWPHFWAVSLWMAFSLLLYCIGAELVRALGKERVVQLLFRRGGASA
ncbi:MAG TPA: hypothetical protein VLW45_13315 [Pelomicrobium sp.]|nr:hypothetical protein [Pelomicrobium sp.]